MMSKFQRIKDAQVAEAEKAGLDNPYQSGQMARTERPVRVSKLKKLQQQQPETLGIDHASGEDESQSTLVVKTDAGEVPVLIVGDPNSRLFENLKAAMETDLQRLKSKHTVEEKAALKNELLPNYLDFIDQYMELGHNYPNSIAVRVLIWLLDVGDIEKSLKLGLYLIRTPHQDTPANFDRDLPTILCDAVYDWANVQWKKEQSASPYIDQLVAVMLDEKWELSLPVRTKMLSMMAKHEFLKGNYANAVHWCDLAAEINPEGHGTKGLRKDAVKKLES